MTERLASAATLSIRFSVPAGLPERELMLLRAQILGVAAEFQSVALSRLSDQLDERVAIHTHVSDDIMIAREVTRRFNATLGKMLGPLPAAPGYRFFMHAGVRFCWNTEPADEPAGKWFSWLYVPVKGKPDTYTMKRRAKSATRAKAKQRALLLWRQARAKAAQS